MNHGNMITEEQILVEVFRVFYFDSVLILYLG